MLQRRKSRASSVSVDFGPPNANRSRSRSFIGPSGPGSGSDSESSSLGQSLNNSPMATPEGTPRSMPAGIADCVINEVLHRLAWDTRLCTAVIEDDMGDGPLCSLVKVLKDAGTLLPLVRDQVQLEFIAHSTEKDAILRGNCVATRLMSSASSLVGKPWVVASLKGTVKRLMREDHAWVLDPKKASPEQTHQLKEDQKRLLEVATTFLKKLRKAMMRTPRSIRCMSYYVWLQARTFCPDRAAVLLGGFVFLRILNPALVAPEKVPGLVPEGEKVTPHFKQNCIALCRLLQNLSNHKLYGDALSKSAPAVSPLKSSKAKGSFVALNLWLRENFEPLESYLLDLATDPELREGQRPFADLAPPVEPTPLEESHLRNVLTDEEWDVLHVALVRCKTHVMVRSTLAPVLGSAKNSTSPRAVSGAQSVPASPNRSRSGSARFRGEDDNQELAIYGDGKMRVRSTVRRSSLTAGNSNLFSNVSQPNLGIYVRPSPSEQGSPVAPKLNRSGSFSTNASRSGSVTSTSPPSPGLMSSHRARSRAGSLAGSPTRISRASSGAGMRFSSSASSSPSYAASDGSSEHSFFALVESLPLPAPVRLERFQSSIAMLQRDALVGCGVLTDGRRASIKLSSSQVELLVRVAVAMRHSEFGLKVESFMPDLVAEWLAKWLRVEQSKDADHIIALMVRNGLFEEKGTRTNRGYALNLGHIAEMSRLLLKE